MKSIESYTGNLWLINDEHAEYDGVSVFLSKLLSNRKVNPEFVHDFLNPTILKLMPDPDNLLDMKKGVERLVSAIKNNEQIAIIGDYDVDGVTSTAILFNYLNEIGVKNVTPYIPHRIDDGYGLKKNILEKFDNHLIITVDNGSTSYEAIEYANSKNIDVIIIDHHEMDHVANAYAVINPHRPDETNQNLKILCAAGVVYLFVIALNRELRKQQYFCKINEPNLLEYVDLVALGTVCDSMQMLGLNRAFVSLGVKQVKKTVNCGMHALLCTSKINISEVNAETLAYSIGPRINASGRLGSAELSFNLLTEKNKEKALTISEKIESLNMQRQIIEAEIMKEILFIEENQKFICVHSDHWHIGIIGIVAGKIKEMHNVPTFVISFNKDGVGHGSARSTGSINLSELITEAKKNGILLGGGGHKLAAGFSIHKNHIEDFNKFLKEKIIEEPQKRQIYADGYISMSGINFQLINEISRLEPFGRLNEKPKFMVPNVHAVFVSVIGKNKNHLSITIEDDFGYRIRCVSFNNSNSKLGRIFLSDSIRDKQMNVLGSFCINYWNGNSSVSMHVDDIVLL